MDWALLERTAPDSCCSSEMFYLDGCCSTPDSLCRRRWRSLASALEATLDDMVLR